MSRVTCPWCTRSGIRLTTAGKLWSHNSTTRDFSGEYSTTCAGVGRLPAQWSEVRKQAVRLDDPIEDRLPNPGSRPARARGCLCSVIDNNHGMWAPLPPHGWLVSPDCLLHNRKATS